jgi:hypothetical protein
MKHLIAGPENASANDGVDGRLAPNLTELSAADLDRVAGAGCWIWGTSASAGTGWYPHSAYPESA